jgi:uncharacterized membrane protein YphA (DoxX/SURF4 family)
MKRATIIEGIVVIYIILFLYTGISKIIDYPTFKEQIAQSPLLGPFSKMVAILVPLIEFTIVILLTVPRWRLKGFYASIVLMTIFTIYIISILSFSKEIPCSCGGIISELSWGQHIFFNSIFIVMAIIAVFFEKKIENTFKQQIVSVTELL